MFGQTRPGIITLLLFTANLIAHVLMTNMQTWSNEPKALQTADLCLWCWASSSCLRRVLQPRNYRCKLLTHCVCRRFIYSGTMMPSKLFCHINLRHLQNQLHCFIWSITFKLFSRVSNNLLKTKCPTKLHDIANIILRKDDCKMGLPY